MDKVIIDDVDVSECAYLNACDKKLKCVILQDDVCETKPYCEGYNCYHKQLKRKEQECEKLKWLLETKCQSEWERENEELKAENEQLKADIQSRTMCITCERDLSKICQGFKKDIETEKSYTLKYYKTLQEIRAKCQITDVFGAKDIRDIIAKINEVIGAE